MKISREREKKKTDGPIDRPDGDQTQSETMYR